MNMPSTFYSRYTERNKIKRTCGEIHILFEIDQISSIHVLHLSIKIITITFHTLCTSFVHYGHCICITFAAIQFTNPYPIFIRSSLFFFLESSCERFHNDRAYYVLHSQFAPTSTYFTSSMFPFGLLKT